VDDTQRSLSDVRAGLVRIAEEAGRTFGGLDPSQLNWRPDATRWSVGQCFDHLIATNRLIRQSAEAACRPDGPRTIWQRLPVLPGLFGRLLIRTQGPRGTRKFTAPPAAQPAATSSEPDVIQRFARQQVEFERWLGTFDEARLARVVMVSPFVSYITYSVLDASRIVVAHNRRHVEQARQVLTAPGFPLDSRGPR
jgi:hypothetical protein